MPYTLPTAAQFQTRFPVFGDTDEALITMLINEASGSVGLDWREEDYQPAIMYLAAHLLATDNSAEGDDVAVGAAGAGAVASESFGGMSISYAQGQTGGTLSSNEMYGSTVYGRRYLVLLTNNVPAILVV